MCIVVCTTPLQMLIACKLIDLKVKRKVDILVLTSNLNSKYLYYIDMLRRSYFVNEIYIIERKSKGRSILNKIINFYRIMRWCASRKYSTAYFASIDNFYIHFILNKCQVGEIYTFDDGTMNVVESSDYFLSREVWFFRIVRVILNLKWNLAYIKMKTRRHYTIYHNMKNIVENTEGIDLFEIEDSDIDGVREEIDIYIGQPFLNKTSSINVYEKLIVRNENIKYYVHPREDLPFIISQLSSESILQSDLIIEDFIILLLKQGYAVNLFTISSSAGFNLYNVRNVVVHFILEESLVSEVGCVFDLIKKRSLRTISI